MEVEQVQLIEVLVELPEPLVALFQPRAGDLCQRLGAALELGLSEEARPQQIPAADAVGAIVRQQQLRNNLLHFFGQYWYLALTVAQLQRDVDRLEQELQSIAGLQSPSTVVEQAKRDFAPPPLMKVSACAAQSVLEAASRTFAKDATSDPAATAITFGAGPILLERLLATASIEEIRGEIGRYSMDAAALHYRVYVLGHDRQVLEFRLAAQRAQARLRKPQ